LLLFAAMYNYCTAMAVTPPGYYTANGATLPCPAGTFRADWLPASQASSCTSCGVGVKADKTDRVTRYFVNGSSLEVAVTTSADDCCEWGYKWVDLLAIKALVEAFYLPNGSRRGEHEKQTVS